MSTILERLALVVEGLSAESVVPVPVRWVHELLAGVGAPPEPDTADFTVADLAQRFRRSPSTVRCWLEADRLPGAYKLRGRDWRVPRAALDAFLAAERAGDHGSAPRAARDTQGDLSDWRASRKAA